jgi:hypothetical protein
MEDLNTIKKELYKQKPQAELLIINKDGMRYEALLDGIGSVVFVIPLAEIGDARFYNIMDAKLLIRWILV